MAFSLALSPAMVKAYLAGRKGMTRRVMLPQPVRDEAWMGGWVHHHPRRSYAIARISWSDLCPYGHRAGDQLLIKEATFRGDDGHAYYFADKKPVMVGETTHALWLKKDCRPYKVQALGARYMRHEWARFKPKLTQDPYPEQVQDITYGQIATEGLDVLTDEQQTDAEHMAWARRQWIDLWDSLNAGRGYAYATNPWVWVYRFERHRREARR